MSVLLNTGRDCRFGAFQPQASPATRSRPENTTVGDFGRYALPNLVTANNTASSLSVILNNVRGGFSDPLSRRS